ncbi:MAG: MarR family transcriptional regulator [Alphaproteobacteria bacterium]|nr:MarR family transcriptional regulator [Alphaproteobacteria bacterium]
MTAGPAAALDAWRRALVASLRLPGPDLSARQLAVLLQVYTQPPPHTVVALATAFDVPHQAISRAVAALERQGLVTRARDENDRRVVHVQTTVKGAVYLRDFADLIAAG